MDAYKYLQDAIARADVLLDFDPFTPVHLWVAATEPSNPYRPDRDADNEGGTGLRESTFLLDFNNVQLLGGFFGTETLPEQRDSVLYITVLSGDITDQDECAPDSGNCFDPNNGTPGCDDFCGGDPPDACPGCCAIVCDMDPFCCIGPWDLTCVNIAMDNCTGGGLLFGAYHVVTANSVDASTLLDGFTITQGSASGGPLDASLGGGMLITDSSLSIVRCLITGNSAPAHGGGAMHIQGNSNPLLVNCSLTNNNGGQGGAIHTEFGNTGPTLVNCLLADNFTTFVNPNIDHGGAIDHGGGSPQNPMVLINCTIVNNDAFEGAIYLHFGAHIIIVNSVLWNPGTAEIFIGFQGGSADVTYSDVEGVEVYPGIGNINLDPLFVDPFIGNYRLAADSPCIDVGDPDETVIPCDQFDLDNDGDTCDPPNNYEPTPDLDLGDRIVGTDVDMGAYESVPCPADFDGNCAVDVKDLLFLLGAWGPNPGHPADFDDSGDVGVKDLLFLLGTWGPCPCGAGPIPPPLQEAVEDVGLTMADWEAFEAVVLSLAAELAEACLTEADWDEFVDVMTDPNASQADKDNYDCWMRHYLNHCTGMACTTPNCPGDAPFGHHE